MSRTGAWAALLALTLVTTVTAQPPSPAPQTQERAPAGNVERGRYLVHDVAMCVQCHSPRTRQGELIESRLLTGAPMPVESPFPFPFALAVPQIAGLPGFTGDDVVTLLTTGRRPDGTVPMPPMPSFRMTREDAQAVVSYLRSLGGDRPVPREDDPAGTGARGPETP